MSYSNVKEIVKGIYIELNNVCQSVTNLEKNIDAKINECNAQIVEYNVSRTYNYLSNNGLLNDTYIIRQVCGLGNQLFITSFAYALYKKTGSRYNILFDTSFYIDPFKNM
ncbi:MAG: hypothetical protein LBH46_00655, partial [Rickettsiales bacterium]|nr:hypothetical protein [Rickettsiales bacterium]